MLDKLLKDIAESAAGKPARDIVSMLFEKANVNEFLIAKKLNLTINQTRNLLYRLSDQGIVSFTRKKDKKKGWYTYFWTLNVLKTLEIGERSFITEIQNVQNKINSRERKRFFRCKFCHIEVSEETALNQNFMCSECGEVYELSESSELINELKQRLEVLGKEKLIVDDELKK
jgi:transcription initiation factor TFIIE subunit alpha